ncbi:hypothetical protein SAMN05444392_11082 [Seinonella peptonophila]|uniref:Uncharacterized protein n=1 Tax=Seinonella peptonophila TaxID=112248 RepID=A0A1M4ZRS4_9BACL|nr:hypothetical protein [Seinonella peptonophila]SHF20790.1 hypothetical protein SAMN05444392_11082 [Seinonella peptonophila]
MNNKYYDLYFELIDTGLAPEKADEIAKKTFPRDEVAEYITCPECEEGEEIVEAKPEVIAPKVKIEPNNHGNGNGTKFIIFDFFEAEKK